MSLLDSFSKSSVFFSCLVHCCAKAVILRHSR